MKELKDNHTIEQACNFYMHTPKYAALSSRSQYDYNLNLKHACVTKVQNNKVLGNIKLKDVRFKHITVAYDLWLKRHRLRHS
mgnify:CR=1 FL=1